MKNKEIFYHSVGFNIVKLESILKNGLVSEKYAIENNIDFARNFSGYNLDDTISLVRGIYASINEDGAYKKYIAKGITIEMLLEEKDIIYDTNDRYMNHYDEVLGKDYIDKSNFTSLIIPEEYMDYSITDLPLFSLTSTSYKNIKNTSDNVINYIENTLNGEVDKQEYKLLLEELKLTIKELNNDINNKELQEDFIDIKCALNLFLTSSLELALKPFINKDNITIYDIIEFINKKTLNLPIKIKSYEKGKTR